MAEPQGLRAYFRADIIGALDAVNLSTAAIADHIDTPEMAMYRLGFDTALRAVAVTFGIDWPAGRELTR